MTAIIQSMQRFIGTSTDTKPITDTGRSVSVNHGDEFVETDTKDVYIWEGSSWVSSPTNGIKFWDEGSTTYKGLTFNAEAPQVCSQPYLYAVAEGDISGHSNFAKYGRVIALTSSPVDVWPLAGTYTFPSTDGQGVRIICSATEDLSTGKGAQKIKLDYLTTGYNEATTEISLNGQTAVVATSTNITRVNRAYISQCGTGGVAAGNIDVYSTSATSPAYARIETGLTQTRQLIYTVPSSKTLYITSENISAGVSTANKFQYCVFTLLASVDPGTAAKSSIFYPYSETGILNNAFHIDLDAPIKVPATADLKVKVHGDTTSGSICLAAIRGWIE